MKALYLSFCCLLWLQASSQQPQFEYCQIVAFDGADKDPEVEEFLFGRHQKNYADSMLKEFRHEYQLKRKRHANATDAMNFLAKLGWELHIVYIEPSRSAFANYYYVMKRPIK